MSLKFILGPSGSGKSRMLFETVLGAAARYPERRYIVLVPEQFTLQTQKELVRLSERGGILNIDVLSFTRLAYRVFEQTGFARRSVLSETGKSLLIRLAASRQEENLGILRGIVDRPGAVAEIKSILSELDQYQVTQDDLFSLENDLASEGTKRRLREKIHEIRLMRDEFESYQADRFITGEKLPVMLAKKIPLDRTLRGTEFFLDGYTGFTPAQLEVITSLLRTVSQITVTATIDPDEPELRSPDPIRSLKYSGSEDYELFTLTKRTLKALICSAGNAQVPVSDPVILGRGRGRHLKGGELAYLEEHLLREGRKASEPYPGSSQSASGLPGGRFSISTQIKRGRQIFFMQCADPYDEVVSAAAAVREMTSYGFRYRDIAIVCGSLPEYAEYAGRVLTEYDIPYFIDRSSAVTLNPAFEFAESSIEVVEKNFSYESVMRFLRTSLAIDNEDGAVDMLENYVLAAGIRGRKAWNGPFTRETRDGGDALRLAADCSRAKFMEHFAPYADVMKKTSASVRDRARALWELFLAFDVPSNLEAMSIACGKTGLPERASEYRQVMRVMAQVLDEAVMLMGDEPVTRTQFDQILKAGFSESRIGTIPPGVDQVHVGDLRRTRLEHVRALIFLGMNDGFIPQRRESGGILTDIEREYLQSRHLRLAPTAREDAGIQQFYLYLTLTKPSDALILSWSAADMQGSPRRRSYAADFAQILFPGREMIPPASSDPYKAVTSRRTGLRVLAQKLSDIKDGNSGDDEKDDDSLKELLKIYLSGAEGEENQDSAGRAGAASDITQADEIIRSAFADVRPARLDTETARQLYGDVLKGSISRLEEYALCPFRQYAGYGLRLRDREEFEVQLPDIGNLLHAAVEIFSKRLSAGDGGITWRTVPDEVRDRWAVEAVLEAAESGRPELYRDTARGRDILGRCCSIMVRSARTMQTQVRDGLFVPARFEVDFGYGDDIIISDSSYGTGSMRLRGRIDRIDECDDPKEKKLYLRIIDYKTSAHRLQVDRIIDGEQLQLVAYLDAAAKLEREAHPDRGVVCAGIFYYDLQDPMLKAEDTGDDTEGAVLKKMRLSGIFDKNPDVVNRLDASLTAGKESRVIPVKMNANGETVPKSQGAFSQDQISLIRRYVRGRMAAFSSDIQSGVIEARPSRHSDQETACSWCRFRDVCHFDPHAKLFSYAQRLSRSDEEQWELIKRGAEGNDGR